MLRIQRGLVGAFALLVLSRALAAPPEGRLEVTHLANEGFLLQGGGRKVLVDALFDGIAGYAIPGEELAARLQAARPPFDGVRLVLATHFHDDHFSPGPVRRHLLANPGAVFLSTPQAVKRLDLGDDPRLAGRVLASLPPEGEVEVRNLNGVRIEILNLHHGRDHLPPVQNLGFIIHIGGKRVLHIGDTEAGPSEFAELRLSENPVDLALLPGWFLTSAGDWRKVVREQIQPRAIGAMHLAEEGAPASYFGSDGSLENRVRRIQRNYPQVEVFSREMQKRVY